MKKNNKVMVKKEIKTFLHITKDKHGNIDIGVAVRNSIRASLMHNSTYRSNVKPSIRKKFRVTVFAKHIQKYAEKYSNPVSEERHIKNIRKMCDDIANECGDIFIDSKLKFGTGQKALNLYLKYLWCFDQITTPPHCPVDSIILQHAKINGAWTKLDCEDTYRCWIKKLKIKQKEDGYDSLQHWELSVWNES